MNLFPYDGVHLLKADAFYDFIKYFHWETAGVSIWLQ